MSDPASLVAKFRIPLAGSNPRALAEVLEEWPRHRLAVSGVFLEVHDTSNQSEAQH